MLKFLFKIISAGVSGVVIVVIVVVVGVVVFVVGVVVIIVVVGGVVVFVVVVRWTLLRNFSRPITGGQEATTQSRNFDSKT